MREAAALALAQSRVAAEEIVPALLTALTERAPVDVPAYFT